MQLTNLFNWAHDDVPLEKRAVLEVGPRGWFDDDLPGGYESSVVNFNAYLDDGRAPSVFGYLKNDQYIDWNSDDEFTRALEQIKSNSQERIERSPELQELLAKESWTKEDRMAWERGISEIVSEEHAQIKGLSRYRNAADTDLYPETKERVTRVNDLSIDIKNETVTLEHDCETHSLVEGVVLQQMENHFLPEDAPGDGYKQNSDYFYASGRTNFNPAFNGAGGHAYIVSSATANVIEATALSSPYKENVDPAMTFKDFVDGRMIVNTDASMYSGYHHSQADFAAVRFERGDISVADVYERTPLIEVLKPGAYDGAPPEAQALMDLKQKIVDLEKLRDSGCALGNINGQIEQYKSKFEESVTEQVQDASIFDSMNFIQTAPVVHGVYMDDEQKLSLARDQLKEMNPDWSEKQLNRAVFDLRIGNIPEIEDGTFANYDAFKEAKAREYFARDYPDMDFDEARSAFNTGAVNNMLSDLYRGNITREELLRDPDAAKALAYTETYRDAGRDFPKPGSALAYGQLRYRLDDLDVAYQGIKNDEACRALEADAQSRPGFSIFSQ